MTRGSWNYGFGADAMEGEMNLRDDAAIDKGELPKTAGDSPFRERRLRSVTNQGARAGDQRGSVANHHFAVDARYRLEANTELQKQLDACQESERARIAFDLHDSIGSSLSALKFGLEDAIKRVQTAAPAVDVAPLHNIASELKNAIEEVRRIAMNLRPSVLDDLGIFATICWFCRELEARYEHLRVVKQLRVEEKDVPNALKTSLFRLLQEAANNTVKHGNATQIRITLKRCANELRLVVEDNGKGFDILEVQARNNFNHHFGIASMRQRMQCSGGTLGIESSPGAGTRVVATWPIAKS
jgi:signal transduction histidine kinase